MTTRVGKEEEKENRKSLPAKMTASVTPDLSGWRRVARIMMAVRWKTDGKGQNQPGGHERDSWVGLLRM